MIQIFEWKYVWKFLPRLIRMIPITLEVWIGAILCGVLIGGIFAFLRIRRIPVLTGLTRVVISMVRGIPPITLLFTFYYGLPQVLQLVGIDISSLSGFWFVVLAYGLSNGAAISENLRAAYASVGIGQQEAAYSIGMTGSMTFFRVMLPQALSVAMPGFVNLMIAALKNTSLAFSVGVIEIMTTANQLAAATQHRMESYVALAIVYYVLYLLIKWILDKVESKIHFERI